VCTKYISSAKNFLVDFWNTYEHWICLSIASLVNFKTKVKSKSSQNQMNKNKLLEPVLHSSQN
jgi:hypothetical protein